MTFSADHISFSLQLLLVSSSYVFLCFQKVTHFYMQIRSHKRTYHTSIGMQLCKGICGTKGPNKTLSNQVDREQCGKDFIYIYDLRLLASNRDSSTARTVCMDVAEPPWNSSKSVNCRAANDEAMLRLCDVTRSFLPNQSNNC